MFYKCTNLSLLDVRSIEFDHFSSLSGTFDSVPTTCKIIVKDEKEKTWFASNFSRFTNVVTAEEYENQ